MKDDNKEKNNSTQKPNLAEIGTSIAEMFNYKLHADILQIPILKGFQILKENNPQTIVTASTKGFVEQLVTDGHIKENEFDKRINLVINNTKSFMKDNGYDTNDKTFIFHKNYNNGVFEFKLYFCDMIIPDSNEEKIIRQLNAFFVEPKMNDFYQFSLSTGPFKKENNQIKIGEIDLKNDQVTITLDKLMDLLMDNLKYKN